MTGQTTELRIRAADAGQRLDRFLADALPGLSRSRVQQLIVGGHVLVDGETTRSNRRLRADYTIRVDVPPPEPMTLDPEEIPLDILFEDDHLLVVNKPAGMSVHPAGPLRSGTLVNALLHHCDRLSGINGVQRPGIVHRLDKDTSGLLVVAKDDLAHRGLARQLEERTVGRRYAALVWGKLPASEGRIEGQIGRHPKDRKRMAVVKEGGRHAATRYEVAETFDFVTRLAVRLETGRTHQIRVHAEHVGHPVFGDSVYGGGQKRVRGIAPQFRPEANVLLQAAGRQMLHAESLAFVHPVTRQALCYESGPPDDMVGVLQRLADIPPD